MPEEKNLDEQNKIDRVPQLDEASLIRPSGVAPISSMDQFAYNYYNAPPPEEGFNVREIWRKVRKRKWLVLAVAFIATTIVTVESYRTKPLYQATAKIAFSNDNPAIIKLGDALLGMDNTERIKTDLLLLRTYPLLAKVVLRLKLNEDPRFLESGGRKTVLEAVQTIFSRFRPKPAVEDERPKSNPIAPPLEGDLSAEEVETLAPYIATLDGSLYVAQIDETKAIQISFTHTDPTLAARVANGVAQIFVDESSANKTAKTNSSTSWLDSTTRDLRAQMEKAEQDLTTYSNSNNIFSTDEKQSLVVGKYADLYGQAVKATTDRKIKESLYNEVREGRVAQLPESFSDPGTIQNQAKLSSLRVELAQANATFGPENPKVLAIQNQIAEIERALKESVKNLEDRLLADFERAKRDEVAIKELLESTKGEAIQQNQASIKYNIYKQSVESTKGLYNDFLKQTNQAQIQEKQQGNDLRIIEPARTPGAPNSPGRSRAILLGLALSLAGGVGLALLLEYLDNTVKSVEDVIRATQLPTLALIPSMNIEAMRAVSGKKSIQQKVIAANASKSEAVGGLAPRSMHPRGDKLTALDSLSSVVESYRMLRTSVLLSTAGTPPKTILITSSQPGEGKTTTAVNTAISLSQLGASVLLIDADLRRPAVHKAFKIPHARGISNYLSSHTPVENLIVKLPIPNLSILPCGPIPPNPAELISSDRMKDLLRNLGHQFDHILIDSPPLISVTDPVILSTMVDGSILVVQAGKSTRELVRRARQELAGVGAKVFGVVLNNVDIKREGYDDYDYYRFSNGYGDGYRGANAG
jgi:capsular exopolysaccharide synthesis family protein